MNSNFTEQPRMYDMVWVHNTKPVWIVCYENENTTKVPHYTAFKVKDYALPLNKFKKLWAHDNEIIGKYGSLEDAMESNA